MIKMGTRGTYGFRYKNKDKLIYNHYDSYPEELGINLLNELKNLDCNKELLISIFKNIKSINANKKPTKKQIEDCKEFTDLGVSNQSESDWYCLLRKVQGTLKPYINKKLKYMLVNNEFIKDSLFCEWGYIINIDTYKFEVWQGFQTNLNKNNRYGIVAERQYYPCKLIREYSLNNLPSDEQFLKDLKKVEKE